MFNPLRSFILTLLKVPPEPQPPAGSPGSLRVFRAGKNYFRLRLFGWGIGQLFALAGIVFWLVMFVEIEAEAKRRKQSTTEVQPFTADSFAKEIEAFAKEAEGRDQPEGKRRRGVFLGWGAFKEALTRFATRLPDEVFPFIWFFKITGVVIYLVQVPVTYFLRRLDFEMRWYIVTDRSLRLRSGVAKVQETTMSFANLQQVELHQNPIQRLLGLGDVRVQSAGGGSGGAKGEDHGEDSMHRAHFHAVDNAHEIRDLILERLRRFRQAGLGDPDDPHHGDDDAEPALAPQPAGSALDAAREVLAEVRALKAALR
jgi:membrane protein YdbS with pleckstrin-like domain